MNDNKAMIELSFGRVPEDENVLRSLTIGLDKVSGFWREEYFNKYIKNSGSKIKFITGKKGSGKSHLLKLLSFEAASEGFLTVSLSSKNLLLSDLTNLYIEIFKALPFEDLIRGCSLFITSCLGYDDYKESDKSFMDWISDQRGSSALIKRELRETIKSAFADSSELDYNFAQVVSIFVGDYLGLVRISDEDKTFLTRWLLATKEQKISEVRAFGLAGYKINKFNARYLIKSLASLVHIAGYNGLYVSIDDLDSMVSTSSLNPVKYTKMRRDDAYEAIRQLIDDIDSFSYFFLAFGFDRVMIDNANNGFKSYQALWLRIQNEIVSSRINLYTDLLDLDQVNLQLYDVESIEDMSKRLSKLFDEYDISSEIIDRETAERLLKESRYGGTSIPLLVNRATLKLEKKDGE